MAWTGSSLCSSFRLEVLTGVHDFSVDSFRVALYTANASLDKTVTSYVTADELPPLNGYMTGGQLVTADVPLLVNDVAIVPFDAVVWKPASFTARGALCYNASKPGLPAVFVLDFGADRSDNAGVYTVDFRGADPANAIVRIA